MTVRNKILGYILVVILLGIAAILYFEADMKGFPDGHLTELDQAEQPLFYVSSILSVFTGLFLLYLARFKNGPDTNRIFYRTLIFLFLAVFLFAGLDWYLVETMDHGAGG